MLRVPDSVSRRKPWSLASLYTALDRRFSLECKSSRICQDSEAPRISLFLMTASVYLRCNFDSLYKLTRPVNYQLLVTAFQVCPAFTAQRSR